MTTDLSPTIVPRSDQLNSDDLLTGPRTITVTKVSLLTAADQPIAINFEGDNGKPYKPCKSMRRVMVSVWGPDGAKYAGRRMTLYRDPTVSFGGDQVGGIRISHMSDIKAPMTMALTVSRARRQPYTVKPLADVPTHPTGEQSSGPGGAFVIHTKQGDKAFGTAQEWADTMIKGIQAQARSQGLQAFRDRNQEQLEAFIHSGVEAENLLFDQVNAVFNEKMTELLKKEKQSEEAAP